MKRITGLNIDVDAQSGKWLGFAQILLKKMRTFLELQGSDMYPMSRTFTPDASTTIFINCTPTGDFIKIRSGVATNWPFWAIMKSRQWTDEVPSIADWIDTTGFTNPTKPYSWGKPSNITTMQPSTWPQARVISEPPELTTYDPDDLYQHSFGASGGGGMWWDSANEKFYIWTVPTLSADTMESSADDYTAAYGTVISSLNTDVTVPPLSNIVVRDVQVNWPVDAALGGEGISFTDIQGMYYSGAYLIRRDGGWNGLAVGTTLTSNIDFFLLLDCAPDGTVTKTFVRADTGTNTDAFVVTNAFGSDTPYDYRIDNTADGSGYTIVGGYTNANPSHERRRLFQIWRNAGEPVNTLGYTPGPLDTLNFIYDIYVANTVTVISQPDRMLPPVVATSPNGSHVIYAIPDLIFYEDRPNGDLSGPLGERLTDFPDWPPKFRLVINPAGDYEAATSFFTVETDVTNGVSRSSSTTERWHSSTGMNSAVAVNNIGQYVVASLSHGYDGTNGFRNKFSIFNGTLVEDPDSTASGTTSFTADGGGNAAAITETGIAMTVHRNFETTGTSCSLKFRVADGSTYLFEQDVTSDPTTAQPGKIARLYTMVRAELYPISDTTVVVDGVSIWTRTLKAVLIARHTTGTPPVLFNEYTLLIKFSDGIFDAAASGFTFVDAFEPPSSGTGVGGPTFEYEMANLNRSYAQIIP